MNESRPSYIPGPLMSVEDLATYLQIPMATLYAYRTRGIGPKAYKVGRYVRYRQADVEAWLEEQAAD